MKEITINEQAKSISESLGISRERLKELTQLWWPKVRTLYRRADKGEEVSKMEVIKAFVEQAKNEQELVLCAFVAGGQIEKRFSEAAMLNELFGLKSKR